MAVDASNDRILRVGGGGRGRFDDLRPWTKAIIVDDDVSPGLLNLADNRITSPYSRGSEQVERERLGMFLAFQEKFNQALDS